MNRKTNSELVGDLDLLKLLKKMEKSAVRHGKKLIQRLQREWFSFARERSFPRRVLP